MVIEVEVVGRVERVSVGSSVVRSSDLLLCIVVGTSVVGTSVGRSWSPPALISL